MAKIKIERVDELTPSSSTLCCKIHPQAKCSYCGLVMCKECAKKWSGRKHFVLDMCRKRFTDKELRDAATCFKKRLGKDGSIPKGLGTCYICMIRQDAWISDRSWVKEHEQHL